MNNNNLEYTINIDEYTIADKKIKKFSYTISLFDDATVLYSSGKKEYIFDTPQTILLNPSSVQILDCVVSAESVSNFLETSIIKECISKVSEYTYTCNLTHTNVSKY